jgi:hypothetical protein
MPGHPYPMQETPLRLPSGRVVAVLNLIATRKARQPGGTFSVQYRTAVPASDPEDRRAEAAEVVGAYAAFAEARGYGLIRAEVCNTRAAAETREGPEAIFRFGRGPDGRWLPRADSEPPSRPAS